MLQDQFSASNLFSDFVAEIDVYFKSRSGNA